MLGLVSVTRSKFYIERKKELPSSKVHVNNNLCGRYVLELPKSVIQRSAVNSIF